MLRVAGEVVAVEERPDDLALRLGDGRVLKADHAVLAIGNYPPSDPPAADSALAESIRYARDPWSRDALEMDRDEDVLLVGTGLTMCDIALALRDADHRGRIHAISRRGLLPQPHRVSAKPPPTSIARRRSTSGPARRSGCCAACDASAGQGPRRR